MNYIPDKVHESISSIQMYQCGPFDAYWTGIGAWVEDEVKDGCHLVTLTTGWTVKGEFWIDNMGRGFSSFEATHDDFKGVTVFGDYNFIGVFSADKAALEKFVTDHPPYDCD